MLRPSRMCYRACFFLYYHVNKRLANTLMRLSSAGEHASTIFAKAARNVGATVFFNRNSICTVGIQNRMNLSLWIRH